VIIDKPRPKIRIPQSYIDQAIDALAEDVLRYQQSTHVPRIERVVGIANSGLHISKPLSTKLGLPHDTVRISHYDGTGKRAQPIIYGSLHQPDGNLIVDDMVDGGSTIRTFIEHFAPVTTYFNGLHNHLCFVWWNCWSEIKCDMMFYYDHKPRDCWLVLPWDEE
jgi:hypoxanthine phosphoribosyltransferase